MYAHFVFAQFILNFVTGQSSLDSFVTRGFSSKYANNGLIHRKTCQYVKKTKSRSSMSETYCPRSSNCVTIRVYKKDSRNVWMLEEERMGCQTTTHKILQRLCLPKACYLSSMPLVEDKQRLYRYCCCIGDGCNKLIYNDSEFAQSTTIAPPLTPKNSTLLLTVIISSVILLHIIILCLAVVYISNKIHKRRLANRQANPLVMMRTQNLAPITPEAMSEETLNDILRGNLIHQGAMSAVRLATYKGQEVAVKVYQPCSNKRWLNEKEIYEVLGDHPNIAKFITSDQYPQDFGFEGMIVLAHYSQGPLLNYLRNNTLSWEYMIQLAYSITNGLTYLHKENTGSETSMNTMIAHRDLTSRNVLIKGDGTCALADFGCALRLEKGESMTGKFPLVGCPRYMAPEVLDGSILHRLWVSAFKQADCYGLALLFWELCRRCHDIVVQGAEVPDCLLPFEEELGSGPCLREVMKHVCRNEQRPLFPSQWIQKNEQLELLKQTITNCWDQEGDARLTSSCVLNRLKQLRTHICDSSSNLPQTSSKSTPRDHNDVVGLRDSSQDLDRPLSSHDVNRPLLSTKT